MVRAHVPPGHTLPRMMARWPSEENARRKCTGLMKNLVWMMLLSVLALCVLSVAKETATLRAVATATMNAVTTATAQGRKPLETATKNAATGSLFTGVKTRTFTRPLKCSRRQMETTLTHKQKSRGNGLFDENTPTGMNCSLWAVVTTIHAPTESIQEMSKLARERTSSVASAGEWCLVIVGDSSTPDDAYTTGMYGQSNAHDKIIYLSVDDQEKIHHDFVRAIPYRSFARKNIGYLYAIAHGAKAIFDFDDDNLLKAGQGGSPMAPFSLVGNRQNMLFRYLPSRHVYQGDDDDDHPPAFNPFPLMKPSHFNTWPRGFPLEQVQNPKVAGQDDDDNNNVAMGSLPLSSVGVIQSVCDGDPDVDAVYRLTRPLPVVFDDSHERASKLLVPSKLYAPYNAQATMHTQAAFWGLLLPFTVTGRVSDIWRSYFTQRIMHDLNLVVLYAPPMVTHFRNQHNYMADLQAEEDLYRKTTALLKFLSQWKDDGDDAFLPARIEKLWVALYEREYIALEDVLAMQLWLLALRDVGYDFPLLPPPTSDNDNNPTVRVIAQPSIRGQPLLARPYFNVDDEGLTYPEFLRKNGLDASNESSWEEWISQTPPIASSNTSNRRRPDKLIVKLVMMTKDEWPLLLHWTVYHGELLGFENIYIVDDSKDPRCITFLRHARDHWGANVIFSTANLNEVTRELTQIGIHIQGSSDLTLKVDTDEFFTVNEGNTACVQAGPTLSNCTLSPYAVEYFLRDMDQWARLAKGQPLKVGYVSATHPVRALCEEGRGNDIIHIPFSAVGLANFKAVSDSRSFKGYDLGGHNGEFYPPMALQPRGNTRIGILHAHHRCYEHEVENCRKAVVSHEYIPPNATDEQALQILTEQFVGPQGACSINSAHEMKMAPASYHKILAYAKSLECPERHKEEYYKNPGALPFHPESRGDPQVNEEFARFMDHAAVKYGALWSGTNS